MGMFGDNLPRIAASPLFFLSNLHVKESQMTITSTEMNFKLIALLLSFALIFPTRVDKQFIRTVFTAWNRK
jgi:hypothetical protein